MTCEQTQPTTSPVKRGDSFSMACTYKQNGTPTSVTPYTIRSQIRDSSGGLVQELTVSKANQAISPGVFALSAGVTTTWPVDLLKCDIQFSEGQTVASSQTFYIPVQEDVTQ